MNYTINKVSNNLIPIKTLRNNRPKLSGYYAKKDNYI